MLLLASALALLAQDAVTHAPFHPQEAQVFVEVPDLHAVRSAYGDAPLTRLFADPELRRSLGTFHLGDHVQKVIAALAGEPATAALEGLRGASLSVSFPAGAPILEGPFAGTGASQPSIAAVLDCEAPERARALAALLPTLGAPLADASAGPDDPPTFAFTALPSVPFWCLAEDARVVIGGGSYTASAFRATVDPESAGLANDEAYRDATRALGRASGAVLVEYWQRVPTLELVESLTRFADVRIPGIESVPRALLGSGVRARMELRDGRFVSTLLSPGTDTASLLGVADLPRAWLETVPADAKWCYVTAIEPQALGVFLRTMVQRLGVAEGLGSLEFSAGYRLDELLQLLGRRFVGFGGAPSGIGIPDTFVTLDVRDPDAFRARIDALAPHVATHFPGFGLETRDYPLKTSAGERLRVPITTLSLPRVESDLPIQVSPAFALVGRELVLSFSSMHLKEELKRRFGEREDGASSTSLADALPFAEHTRSVYYQDWAALLGGVLDTVRALAPMLDALELDLPIDLAGLPGSAPLRRHLAPTTHLSERVEAGLLRHHVSSFGPETWLVAGGFWSGVVPAFEPPSDPALDSAPRGAVLDEAELALRLTRSRLAALEAAIAAYAEETGAPPESLAELTRATTTHAQGFLESPALTKDAWGRDFRYRANARPALWSVGPDGADEEGQGDDVAAD